MTPPKYLPSKKPSLEHSGDGFSVYPNWRSALSFEKISILFDEVCPFCRDIGFKKNR
jgi:hypothetical protein